MDSNINDVFLQLVKDIVYWGNIEEEDICERVGRNKGYISQIKSRIKSGKGDASEGFVNLLKLEFAEELKRKNSGSVTVEDVPTKTLTFVLRALAKINILFTNEAQKIATKSGQDPDLVLHKMNDDAEAAANSLFDEVLRKS